MKVFDAVTQSEQEISEESINILLWLIFQYESPTDVPPITILLCDNDNISFPDTSRICSDIRLLTPLNQGLENRCLDLPNIQGLISKMNMNINDALLTLRNQRKSWLKN